MPGEEPQPAEVLAEDQGNTEWVVEESSYKCYDHEPVTETDCTGHEYFLLILLRIHVCFLLVYPYIT